VAVLASHKLKENGVYELQPSRSALARYLLDGVEIANPDRDYLSGSSRLDSRLAFSIMSSSLQLSAFWSSVGTPSNSARGNQDTYDLPTAQSVTTSSNQNSQKAIDAVIALFAIMAETKQVYSNAYN
jgi:hypothetical protein